MQPQLLLRQTLPSISATPPNLPTKLYRRGRHPTNSRRSLRSLAEAEFLWRGSRVVDQPNYGRSGLSRALCTPMMVITATAIGTARKRPGITGGDGRLLQAPPSSN